MILEKRLTVPDPKFPNTSGFSPATLEALVIGQGPNRKAPSILTIEMEMKSWKEEKYSSNGKTYRLQDVRTVLYEFDAETGALERACTYRGNKFEEKHFRFYERLMEEWLPAKKKKPTNPAGYNATIAKAYNTAAKIRDNLLEQKNKPGCRTKEVERLDYFLSGLNKICGYDKEKIKIKQ